MVTWLRHRSPQRRLMVRVGALGVVMVAALWLIAWAQQRTRDRVVASAPRESAPTEPDTKEPLQAAGASAGSPSARSLQPIPDGPPPATTHNAPIPPPRTVPHVITPPVSARWSLADENSDVQSASEPAAVTGLPSGGSDEVSEGSLAAAQNEVQLLPPPEPPRFADNPTSRFSSSGTQNSFPGDLPEANSPRDNTPPIAASQPPSPPPYIAPSSNTPSIVPTPIVPTTSETSGSVPSTGNNAVPANSADVPAAADIRMGGHGNAADTEASSSAGSVKPGSPLGRQSATGPVTTDEAERTEQLAESQGRTSVSEDEPHMTGTPRGLSPPVAGSVLHQPATTRLAIPPAALTDEAPPASRMLPVERPAANASDWPNASRQESDVQPLRAADVAPVPGPPTLEGLRTPSLVLEKLVPPQVQVGREATFSIRVKNVGQVTAHQVVIHDAIPRGAKLVSTTPQAQVDEHVLSWFVGQIAPGAEVTVSYIVVPEVEGELGSVAEVIFAAQASARTVSTRPVLKLEVHAPPRVLVEDSVRLQLTLRNEGSGPAQAVVLEEDVPAEFSHPAGRELQNFVGLLRPGESRHFELELIAERPGRAINRVRVRDDKREHAVLETPIEVVAPELKLHAQGPTLRYLERKATYQITLENAGTAAAVNVDLVVFLPQGFQFVAADKLGRYSTEHHAVYWSLAELPARQAGTVQVTVLAVEPGEQKLRAEARAERHAAAATQHTVRVESVAELHFTLVDLLDPVEVGTETTYELELVNRGTRADTNILVTAEFSPELQPLHTQGVPTAVVNGQQINFAPLPQLEPGQRVVLRITAVGRKAGIGVLRAHVRSDQMTTPIAKEEATRVYSD